MNAAWFPLALATDIAPSTSTGSYLHGEELVIWRDPDGAAHVWHDRCPHRGMRLSLGFLRGDQLACAYHGWRFDTSGRCRFIPAHPHVAAPRSVATRRFCAAEAYGMVWGRLVPPANDAGSPPDAGPPGADEPVLPVLPVRSVTVRRQVADVLATLRTAGLFDPVTPVPGAAHALLTTPTPAGRLVIGVQPLDATTTALHLSHAGAAPTELLVDFAHRAAELRAGAEAGADLGVGR